MKNIVLLILLAFSINSCKDKEVELMPQDILTGGTAEGKKWRIVENYNHATGIDSAQDPCHKDDTATIRRDDQEGNFKNSYTYTYHNSCNNETRAYEFYFSDPKTFVFGELGEANTKPIAIFEVIKLTKDEFYAIANKGTDNEVRWRFVPLELEEENN